MAVKRLVLLSVQSSHQEAREQAPASHYSALPSSLTTQLASLHFSSLCQELVICPLLGPSSDFLNSAGP